MKYFYTKGITLLEVIITVAILGIITSISVTGFSSLSNSESLDKETGNIISYIDKARNNAINSLDFLAHGVQFASTTVSVFYGTNPATAATTTVYTLSSKETIWNVSLGTGQSYLYFNKLTGKPNTTGTLKVKNRSGGEKTITIYATGFVEVQ